MQQAKESGCFLTQAQCVSETLAEDADNDCNKDNQQNHDQELDEGLNCCWSKILSKQSDFLNERPLLQTIIEDAGHVCLFLPKFHCELNPIELFWSYIKECE
jgi:hypothetical protein